MARRSLQSQTGEQITWLEAVIRATKGLRRPARVNEISDYMLEHVITGYPDKAKTPLQTIYMVLYTHSKDSAVGIQSEHIFYTTGRGLWGLCNPDKWRKHRSDKTCEPVVMRVMEDTSLFYSEELADECTKLREKAEEWELLFGEIMLLDAVQVKDRITKEYLRRAWQCAGCLKPFLNCYIWEITDEQLEEIVRNYAPARRNNVMRWIHSARKSEYNTKKTERNHGIHIAPDSCRESRAKKFISDISFPEDYVLPHNAHLSTVFKYWLWLNKDEYVQLYLHQQYGIFQKMKPLHEKPYRLIRPDHIRACMDGLPQSRKNSMIVLYHAMDMIAYEMDLIPKMYSKSLRTLRPRTDHLNEFTQAEIDRLKEHAGELEVDMTLVLLYTGLYSQEICVLTSDDMDSRYIHLPNEKTNLYGRDIPLHPVIVQPLKHVLRFLEAQDAAHVIARRRRYGVRKMVGEATERYCGRKHTAKQCRSSFASRIEEAGASGGMITALLGTKLSYWNGFSVAQQAYSHPSRDNIYEAVMNVR